METCLNTQLKASSNNPNLPILEKMEQFTLNAIAKGGNMSMTDVQKWALNHFFYEIGAIQNTALWGKIRLLMLPIIGIDKDHVLVDYKDDGITFFDGGNIIKDQAGALEYESGTYSTSSIQILGKTFSSDANFFNSSLLCATSPGATIQMSTFSNIGLQFSDTNNVRYTRSFDATTVISAMTKMGSTTFSSRLDSVAQDQVSVAICNYDKTHNTIFALCGDAVKRDTSMTYGDSSSLPNTVAVDKYLLYIGSGKKYGILMDFNDKLSDSESVKVLNAVNSLRSAFVV